MHLTHDTLISFDDICIRPQYSDIRSRKEIDLKTVFKNGLELNLPFIGSPMDTVCDHVSVSEMNRLGGTGILHRYANLDRRIEQVKFVKESSTKNSKNLICVAVGVKEGFLEEALSLEEAGANCICVDVAHGHHILVKEAVEKLRTSLKSTTLIMAGNVADSDGFKFLQDAGADMVRIGISPGAGCKTFQKTGHGMPVLSSLLMIGKLKEKTALAICDGGIKDSGHICIALAAGADLVMMGSVLAAHEESPGNIIFENGKQYKEYAGMASPETQMKWFGSYSSDEGGSYLLPYKGRLSKTFENLERGVRSGISYSGSRNIKDFQRDAILDKMSICASGQLLPHAEKTR